MIIGRASTLLGAALVITACGSRTGLEVTVRDRRIVSPGSESDNAATARDETPLCVFDYDLTLSSHLCAELEGDPDYFCRENTGCDTYGWYSQCLGRAARSAVAECVARGAYIGIASHADADACWFDKVTTIVTEQQFPEFTSSSSYDNPGAQPSYPRIDDRNNWNCENCAYTMSGAVSKPSGIRRVMRHYGLDPDSAREQARVIFWDDTPNNIFEVNNELPQVHAIEVPRFTSSGFDGGCGLTEREIDLGWSAFEGR